MSDNIQACLDKRFETPALQQVFNWRVEGEGRSGRRKKKPGTEDEGEKLMLAAAAAFDDAEELAIHRSFIELISSCATIASTLPEAWTPDTRSWELRMRVGWEVFHGRGREARDLVRTHVAALEAGSEAREAELDKKEQSKTAPKGEPSCSSTGKSKKRRLDDKAVQAKGSKSQRIVLQVKQPERVGKAQERLKEKRYQSPEDEKPDLRSSPGKAVIPIRTVIPQATSMEDYINQQSRILPPTIPLIPKLKRGHDPLTDRLSSKLLGTLNLSHVDSEAMAEFRAKQPSKRYRRALDRASSSLTPLPEDREVKPRAPQRNAKVQNDMPDREGGNERSKRAPVVLQEAGIPAKTFRAVMRLVLGLPLVAAAPRVRMQAPRKRPPVWAESRQELCEALPYYRSFQSSLYMYKRTAYSYLLDGYPSPRDAWAADGRVIISHGGGQCVRTVKPDGTPVVSLQADQSPTDARVDALLQCERNQTPIILIAGEGYAQLPWKMPHAYAVLGWYWISHTWVEAEYPGIGVDPGRKGYFLRYKIRFDWVEGQGTPWWLLDSEAGREEWKCDPPKRPLPLQSRPARTEEDPTMPKGSSKLAGLGIGDTAITPDSKEDSLRQVQQRLWLYPDEADQKEEAPPTLHRPTRPLPGESLLRATPLLAWQDMKHSSQGPACRICKKHSPRVYAEGWICLRPSCARFWMLGDWPIPPGFTLTYAAAFLRHKATPSMLEQLPFDVRPPAPFAPDEALSVDGRTLWRGWECKACGQLLAPWNDQIVPARSLQLNGPLLGDVEVDPGADIRVTLSCLPNTLVSCYKLPDKGGKVYHLRHQDTLWADELFEAYQQEASGTIRPLFERKPLKGTAIKGQLLAQHFAVNSGATYKYNVSSMSLTFDESPTCVMRSLKTIKERVAAVMGEQVDFNEILSVLYRDGQKMSWHDDGEPGLGNVVSSLSLGSPAVMSWRPKAHRKGHDAYMMGLSSGRATHPPVALSITLAHGDIIIMRGRRMQEKYEHRVVPTGLRVAATARVIGQGHK